MILDGKTIEFGNEGDQNGAPALYINSWYDISVGPNVAMFEYQIEERGERDGAEQYVHDRRARRFTARRLWRHEHTVVGERDMGDARFDYTGFMVRWFDHWLKGVDNGIEQ